MESINIKKLKSTNEAARLLNVTERSVYNYIKQKKLTPTRIGGIKKAGKTYIHIDEIKRFLRG